MRVGILLLVAAAVALSIAAAGAYPTFSGPTGMVALPNAAVAPAGSLEAAIDYQNQEGDTTLWPLRGVYGVNENTEIWAGYELVSGGSNDTNLWNIGAKYLLTVEPKQKISLGLGGSWGNGKIDSEAKNITSFFVVASKNLAAKSTAASPMAAKVSVGMLWQNADSTLTEPFFGIEFAGQKGVSLALDYRVKDSDFDAKAPFSAVVRFPLSQTRPLWAEAGFSNAARMGQGADSSRFFVGLGCRFALPQASSESESGTRTRPWGY